MRNVRRGIRERPAITLIVSITTGSARVTTTATAPWRANSRSNRWSSSSPTIRADARRP
jgi:hypothetical protein